MYFARTILHFQEAFLELLIISFHWKLEVLKYLIKNYDEVMKKKYFLHEKINFAS